MKLKTNQDGIAHLAAILAVVVVVTIGVVGWKVWDNKKSSDTKNNATTKTNPVTKKETPQTPEKQTKLPKDFKQYTNKAKSISLGYPSDWTADKVEPLTDREESFAVFATPDYTKGELGIGGQGVLSGILVTIGTATPRSTDVQQDYKEPKFGTDVTNFTIGGEKAVRYYLAYEGQVYSHAITYRNGVQYNFFMFYTMNDSLGYATTRQKYEPTFLQMLETFHFN